MQVFLMINKYYFILLTIAIVFALPVLNIIASVAPGAYKYKIQWFDYAQVIIAIYFVALLTSGWLSWRAANRNPVEALRYE
jgi:putative ABC transport system permease protein